jgi:hypothetical protein
VVITEDRNEGEDLKTFLQYKNDGSHNGDPLIKISISVNLQMYPIMDNLLLQYREALEVLQPHLAAHSFAQPV